MALLALPFTGVAQRATKKAPATTAAPTASPAVAPTPTPSTAAPATSAPAAAATPAAPAKMVDPPAPEGFQKYYFVMLLKGPKQDQDRAALVKMMEGHLEYMEKLATDRKGLVDGTFMDKGDWRGFMLVRGSNTEEVKTIVDTDPVVAAGRVIYEIPPFMTESTVFEQPASPEMNNRPVGK